MVSYPSLAGTSPYIYTCLYIYIYIYWHGPYCWNVDNACLHSRCIISHTKSIRMVSPSIWLLITCTVFLTHWGRVKHLCVSKLTIIGSDNGLSPGRRQAIVWTIAWILLIGPLGTNFSEISKFIHFHFQGNVFENVVWKMAAILSRPQCVDITTHTVMQCMGTVITYVIYGSMCDMYFHSLDSFTGIRPNTVPVKRSHKMWESHLVVNHNKYRDGLQYIVNTLHINPRQLVFQGKHYCSHALRLITF